MLMEIIFFKHKLKVLPSWEGLGGGNDIQMCTYNFSIARNPQFLNTVRKRTAIVRKRTYFKIFNN